MNSDEHKTDENVTQEKAARILAEYNANRRQQEIRKFLFDWRGLFTHYKYDDASSAPTTMISVKIYLFAAVIIAIIFFGGFALLNLIMGH